ncbi:MAG TPA: aminotransferase class I/II-fold pyridoxal phosphate-dependent enzyme [Acidimicrobiales bacterium]|nr:aminotransferase class I/II-fold pyridoxal phosphate-dependent enzyme [Acidimicrobiales bacterium]
MTAPVPGPHGGDGRRLAAHLGIDPADVLDLSASLNPVAPDPVPVVAAHLDAVRAYPDPARAEQVLADVMGVDPAALLLTNGGAEAIALVAGLRPEGWVEDPDFSLYRRHLARVGAGAPRWRSNPHNPSGRLAPAGARAAVWDEAFWPLATGTWTRRDSRLGSVVLGSLTKLLACPGLRLGYVLCPDGATAEELRRRRPAWSVNGPACAALPDLLAPVDLPKWAAAVAELRADLIGLLTARGYRPEPSDANWVLVDSPGLRDRLAAAAVCVRDCASFGMPGTVRIAVPGPDGLERLEAAL